MDKIYKIKKGDKNYPEKLKILKDAPDVLYAIGDVGVINKSVGIIGTRRCSSYGRQVASEFTKKLVERGIAIISGFAPGIDTVAHISAIESGGRTIAVLGTGLSQRCIYPQENIRLIKNIIKLGGCLLSEYPPETRGTKFTFPQRNRIVATLSDALLVVEAPERSGSIITANYAIKYKKSVFCIPGSIFYNTSKGANWLIKKGCHLCDNISDILQSPPFCDTKHSQNKSLWDNVSDCKISKSEELLVLSVLKNGPANMDKIIVETKMEAAKAIQTVTIMELDEKIKNIGENIYMIN